MKSEELFELNEEELAGKEAELKDQLFKLKFQHTVGQLENAMKMKHVRRDIARVKTLLKQKELSKGTEKTNE